MKRHVQALLSSILFGGEAIMAPGEVASIGKVP
jgi:hypothetical protein